MVAQVFNGHGYVLWPIRVILRMQIALGRIPRQSGHNMLFIDLNFLILRKCPHTQVLGFFGAKSPVDKSI